MNKNNDLGEVQILRGADEANNEILEGGESHEMKFLGARVKQCLFFVHFIS